MFGFMDNEIAGRVAAFLLFENLDRSTWLKTLLDSRSAYAALRQHFLRDLEHPEDLPTVDPLTDDETSPWNTLRHDEILRAEILQDVERCMPENLYFREPTTQSILLDILFIFCKLNVDTGYRQGMHEILAPILWVVSRDAIDPDGLNEDMEGELDGDDLLKTALDKEYIEHDTFSLFCIVMQNAKSFYEMGSGGQESTLTSANNSPIVERSKRIHEEYLRRADPELMEHLNAVEVLPQIFLIRWIRLLFGREFPFDDVLCLWDVLFAEDATLRLVDLICVAMLLRIRWQLIEADYSSALTLLLRYPLPSDTHGPPTFVDDAIHLRQDLSIQGGERIIFKYSGRHVKSTTHTNNRVSSPSLLGYGKRKTDAVHMDRESMSSWNTPVLSPARFLQEQGGIERYLQEAAKGVYNRGEKWGVTKAIRGAVQGLQSGNSSPRRAPEGTRWSLDEGRRVASSSNHFNAKIKALEDRNQTLAKMLDNAMTDLSTQQNLLGKENLDSAADALSLAIAKVQFVQVYLEDSSMPLLPETAVEKADVQAQTSPLPALVVDGISPNEPKISTSDIRTAGESIEIPHDHANVECHDSHSTENPNSTLTPLPSDDKPQTTDSATLPAPVQSKPPLPHLPSFSPYKPRPSLAQSSFSWMLGEDKRKSSFVSASPFPPEKKRESATRGKTGFLFGDERGEGSEKEKEKGKGKRKGKEKKDGDNRNGWDEKGEDDEGFTLGTLRGMGKMAQS
ncbi:MAG: hypothetical protein Q9187_004079 [Circinaria calcarea]